MRIIGHNRDFGSSGQRNRVSVKRRPCGARQSRIANSCAARHTTRTSELRAQAIEIVGIPTNKVAAALAIVRPLVIGTATRAA
jgi:hypothetical protein